VTIWVPAGAPAKLVVHEEGHRRIDERIYDEADAAARAGARTLDGQVLRAAAADCTSAEQNATQSAAGEFCRTYLREIGRRAERIGEEYDRLTAHGTKPHPAEDEAIRAAFKCEPAH